MNKVIRLNLLYICACAVVIAQIGCRNDNTTTPADETDTLTENTSDGKVVPAVANEVDEVDEASAANEANAVSDFNMFDFNAWKRKNDVRIDPKTWEAARPEDRKGSTYARQKDIGPLEIRVKLLDRTKPLDNTVSPWVTSVLSDKDGLRINALEVMTVRKTGPAVGYLKPGDVIVKVGGEFIKSSLHALRHIDLDPKERAWLTLLPHLGTWIDQAEGKGVAELTVLRGTKENVKSWTTAKGIARAWDNLKVVSLGRKPTKVSLSITATHTTIVRFDCKGAFKDGDDWTLTDGDGQSFPMTDLLRIVKEPIKRVSEKLNNTNHRPNKGHMVKHLIEIPDGKWTLSGTLSSKKSTVCTIQSCRTSLPPSLKPNLKVIRIPIDRIGSFGKTFSPSNPKVDVYSRMLAWRLAKQQADDGSWPGLQGSSVVPLALMATGDPAFDPHVKKAAYYVAGLGPHFHAMPMGLRAMFLGEYYLRTRDPDIVPRIKALISASRSFLMSDNIAGHYLYKPWYGGGGWIGGTSYLACGWALFDKAGLLNDHQRRILGKMMARVQQICPNGRMPYGRTGPAYSRREYEEMGIGTRHKYGRHGSACATGPMIVAAKVFGGPRIFVERAEEKWGKGPYGRARNGHCLEHYHFYWACMTAANVSPEAYRNMLAPYLWEFALSRGSDGLLVSVFSSQRYSVPYISTASFLTILNAHKKNLAITGKPEIMAPKLHVYPIIGGATYEYHNHILDTWKLAELALGSRAPREFKAAHKRLLAIEADEHLETNLGKWIKTAVMPVAMGLRKVKLTGTVSSGQVIDMLLGVQLEAATVYEDSKGKKKKGKKKKKNSTTAKLYLVVSTSMPKDGADGFCRKCNLSDSIYPITDMKVRLTDPTGKAFPKPVDIELKDYHGRRKFKSMSSKLPNYPFTWDKKKAGHFIVDVRYKLDGVTMVSKYKMSAVTVAESSNMKRLLKIPIRATLLRDYRGDYTILCRLKTGRTMNFECAGKRDDSVTKDFMEVTLAGSVCDLEVSQGTRWAYRLRECSLVKESNRLIQVKKAVTVDGKDMSHLFDGSNDTPMRLEEKPLVIDVELSQAESLGGVTMAIAQKDKVSLTVEAMINGKWVHLTKTNSRFSYLPVFAKVSKVRLHLGKNLRMIKWPSNVSGIKFYRPGESW